MEIGRASLPHLRQALQRNRDSRSESVTSARRSSFCSLQGLHDPTVSGSSQWRVINSRLPADPARLMSQTSEKHHE
jgi:hypothetical protein